MDTQVEQTHRGPVVRTWVAAIVTFVVVFLAVRWLMIKIWPDEGYLSDLWIHVLRAGTSLALATAAAIWVGILAFGRQDR